MESTLYTILIEQANKPFIKSASIVIAKGYNSLFPSGIYVILNHITIPPVLFLGAA